MTIKVIYKPDNEFITKIQTQYGCHLSDKIELTLKNGELFFLDEYVDGTYNDSDIIESNLRYNIEDIIKRYNKYSKLFNHLDKRISG